MSSEAVPDHLRQGEDVAYYRYFSLLVGRKGQAKPLYGDGRLNVSYSM